MKVLQVNCVYRKGSTGKIVYDIHRGLSERGVASVVCYGRGNKLREAHVYKTCGELYSKLNQLRTRFTGLLYGGCWFSTKRLLRIIEREHPDVVHLQCINGYFVNNYRLLTWLKERKIKTILTLHAEFPYTGNCGHSLECERWKNGCGNCPRLRSEIGSLLFDRTHTSWKKMRKAFEGFDSLTVASVSGWLMERAKLSPLLADRRHTVVMNGIDVGVFHPYPVDELRKQHDLMGKRVVFHATACFSSDPEHIKGGYYLLKLAQKLPEVEFWVAGRCEENLDAPKNLHFLGQIFDQRKLAQWYSLADVTVLTSKRETFSMPVAESLCCGTPVVGFCAGAPERIALPEYSTFVPYGDADALAEAVELMLQQPTPDCAESAKERFASDTMVENYIRLYKE